VKERLAIRLATPREAEAIALESMAEIEHNMGWTWHPDRVASAIDDPDTNVAVAVDGGAVIGFGIMEYAEESAHLVLFAVREDARRRGVGSTLLGWLEKVALIAGVARLNVEARASNATARAFYRSHGYSETDIVPNMYCGGEDGVRLQKVVGTIVKEA